MSFPIPVKYESTEDLNNTRVVYNNGDTLDMIPNLTDTDITDLETKIGTLSELTTTEKTNLVGAINEVDGDVTALKADLNNTKEILEISTEYVPLDITRTAGGFSGNIGEEIVFTTPTAWMKASINPEYGKTYKFIFWNRINISARAYIYAVDANGIILYQYAQMPAQQTEYERQEFELTFPQDAVTVWVCGSNNPSRTIKIYEAVQTTVIDSIETDISEIKDVVMPTSAYDKGPFNTQKFDFGAFYKGKNTDYSAFGDSTTYADVINAFDALMAMDTAHISKNALGTASGTDAGGNPYTVYEYVFSPHTYTATLTVNKNPVILADGSIHGFEKNSTFGLYYFLYDLVNNYYDDPTLTAIRDNVILKIIPVSNPYGFDRGQYTNANNVNINRNFATSDWKSVTDGGSQNSGLEPFDQPESAIIRDWVNANVNNIMAYFNCHTNGRHVTAYSDMNSVMPKFGRVNNDKYYYRLNKVTQRHIQRQTANFTKMYTALANMPSTAFVGKYQTETGAFGQASVWTSEQVKIPSMTFEVFIGIKIDDTYIINQFSNDSKKMSSEMIGNIVAETVFEYSQN